MLESLVKAFKDGERTAQLEYSLLMVRAEPFRTNMQNEQCGLKDRYRNYNLGQKLTFKAGEFSVMY